MASTATGKSTYDADVDELESSIRQLLMQAAAAMGYPNKGAL